MSLLRFLVSHDPSEIMFGANLVLKKHLVLLSNLKTAVLLHIFMGTMIFFTVIIFFYLFFVTSNKFNTEFSIN